MEEPLKKRKKLKLYKALKIAYMRNKPKRQARLLKKYGYILDTDLSDARETMVAYNPFDKKVLFIPNGTEFKNTGTNQKTKEKDLLTDFNLALGGIKQTGRYKDTKNTLTKAHDKYKDANFIVAGHSLGGTLGNYVAEKKDKVITYNAGFSPNMKARENVTNYRTQGDVVSVLAPKQNSVILKPKPETNVPQSNPDSVIYSTLKQGAMLGVKNALTGAGLSAIPATIGASTIIQAGEQLAKKSNLLKYHDLKNIEGLPVFL